MRTRSSGNLNSISCILPRQHFTDTGTGKDGSFGFQNVLPVIRNIGSQYFDGAPVGSYSYIVDEPVGLKKINACYHIRRKIEPYPQVLHVSSDVVSSARTYYNSSLKRYFPSQWAFSSMPLLSAYQHTTAVAFDPFQAQSGFSGESTNDRLGELPSKVLSKLSSLNLAVSAWEAHEFPMLFRQIKGLRKSLPNIFREMQNIYNGIGDRKKRTKKVLEFLRNTELGYQFGLLPTVSDISQITREMLKGGQLRKEVVVRLRDVSTSVSSKAYEDPFYGRQEKTLNKQLIRVFGCKAVLTKDYGKYGKLSDTAKFIDQYVSINPLASAWEVMPWSFVIDWFLSVDKCIDSWFLHNSPNISTMYWKSTKRQYESTLSYSYISDAVSKVDVPLGVYYTSVSSLDVRREKRTHKMEYCEYNRIPQNAPAVLDSVNIFGRMNLKNSFHTLLLIAGLVK